VGKAHDVPTNAEHSTESGGSSQLLPSAHPTSYKWDSMPSVTKAKDPSQMESKDCRPTWIVTFVTRLGPCNAAIERFNITVSTVNCGYQCLRSSVMSAADVSSIRSVLCLSIQFVTSSH
jgi:hypothetical protein